MYGISIKPGNFFSAEVYRFADRETAIQWVHTEEADFREREISDDPEYIWDIYADYLPGRDEMESLDDVAKDYEEVRVCE